MPVLILDFDGRGAPLPEACDGQKRGLKHVL
jgi:hypothetical protein